MPAPVHARLRQAVDLLGQVLQTSIPADAVINQFFRAHRNMGSKDRAFSAEAVYGCLRHKRELEALCEPVRTSEPNDSAERWLVGTWLLKYGGWSASVLMQAGFNSAAVSLVERIRARDLFEFPLAVRANFPDWLADSLVRQLGEDQTLHLANSMNHPAPVDIRANVLKINRDTLQSALNAEGYELKATPYSPQGLRRLKRGPLFKTRAFREGLFELQDEGSQLIGILVEASSKEIIVDFCAGAGGKTLQLAGLMGNTGVVHAFDISRKRLDRLRPRLARAGVDNVRRRVIQHENDFALHQFQEVADAVIVDVPCSGTGTLRRNPDIKWKAISLSELTMRQNQILEAASRLVKPGGRLVYATCSLLDEENTAVTAAFLAKHPDFRPNQADVILARQGIDGSDLCSKDGALRLYPHRHGTGGFYALVMQRLTG